MDPWATKAIGSAHVSDFGHGWYPAQGRTRLARCSIANLVACFALPTKLRSYARIGRFFLARLGGCRRMHMDNEKMYARSL